jgi:hypothetical protein
MSHEDVVIETMYWLINAYALVGLIAFSVLSCMGGFWLANRIARWLNSIGNPGTGCDQ